MESKSFFISSSTLSCHGEWRGRHSYSEIQDFILAMIKPSLVLAAGRCNSSHNTVQTRCQYLVWIESILNVLSESPVKMIPFWTVTDQKWTYIIHFNFRQHPLFIYLWTLKIKKIISQVLQLGFSNERHGPVRTMGLARNRILMNTKRRGPLQNDGPSPKIN